MIAHDAVAIALYDPDTRQLRLHTFDFNSRAELKRVHLFHLDGSPEGLAFTPRRPVVIRSLDVRSSRRQKPNTLTMTGCGRDASSGCLRIIGRWELCHREPPGKRLHRAGRPTADAYRRADRDCRGERARLSRDRLPSRTSSPARRSTSKKKSRPSTTSRKSSDGALP